MSDVANGSDVDGRLASNNLGGEGRQDGNIEIFRIGLWGQRRFYCRLVGDDGVGLLQRRLEGLFFEGFDVVLGVDGFSRVRVGLDIVVFGVVGHCDGTWTWAGQLMLVREVERRYSAKDFKNWRASTV